MVRKAWQGGPPHIMEADGMMLSTFRVGLLALVNPL
jgi:hypothetical protein